MSSTSTCSCSCIHFRMQRWRSLALIRIGARLGAMLQPSLCHFSKTQARGLANNRRRLVGHTGQMLANVGHAYTHWKATEHALVIRRITDEDRAFLQGLDIQPQQVLAHSKRHSGFVEVSEPNVDVNRTLPNTEALSDQRIVNGCHLFR